MKILQAIDISRIKNFLTLNDSACTVISHRRGMSSVQQMPSFLPVSACRWKLVKIQKTIFYWLILIPSNPNILYYYVGQQKLHTNIHCYHWFIGNHHDCSLHLTQSKQLFSILNFHFSHTVPNESSLHHHFAAPGTVPQAVILGGEKVVSSIERIIRSIFLHKQPRCANASQDRLLLTAKKRLLVAGRPKTSDDPRQPCYSPLCIWDVQEEYRECRRA